MSEDQCLVVRVWPQLCVTAAVCGGFLLGACHDLPCGGRTRAVLGWGEQCNDLNQTAVLFVTDKRKNEKKGRR